MSDQRPPRRRRRFGSKERPNREQRERGLRWIAQARRVLDESDGARPGKPKRSRPSRRRG